MLDARGRPRVIKVETMRVESGPSGPVMIAMVGGRLIGEDDAERLGNALLSEFDVSVPRLIVNLRECEIMSSASIGVLIRAYSRCKKRNGRFAVCETRPAIGAVTNRVEVHGKRRKPAPSGPAPSETCRNCGNRNSTPYIAA